MTVAAAGFALDARGALAQLHVGQVAERDAAVAVGQGHRQVGDVVHLVAEVGAEAQGHVVAALAFVEQALTALPPRAVWIIAFTSVTLMS
jgi:hypothetical protein